MRRIFSNGPAKDFVLNPLNRLITRASRVYLAAPFFTESELVLSTARSGKIVQLLIGLNASTSAQALSEIYGAPNLAIRYLTRRFHAKVFICDDAAMIGSSNLTDGGLKSNREAVVCLDQADDLEAVEEAKALFLELWEAADVLTAEKLTAFRVALASVKSQGPDPDSIIERAVGRAEPVNIHIDSRKRTQERIFLQSLKRQVYEQYRPAFAEVAFLLREHRFYRPELEGIGEANQTNRFLNWLRLTHVIGDEAWQRAPLRTDHERREEIFRFGAEWATTPNNKIPEYYDDWLSRLRNLFGTQSAVDALSKEDLTDGLMSIHAFVEQLRFVKGGIANLPVTFWRANNDDMSQVKRTIGYLLHGPGEFIQRLHDVLYDPTIKLAYFGQFCALELYGTLNPEECPPMNGRMAKALRFLGFDVRGS
jgi:HKD family nuclease